MPLVSYDRVWCQGWGAWSAAGDAAATWADLAAGRCRLSADPELGCWVGRAAAHPALPSAEGRMLALAWLAAEPALVRLGDPGPWPVLAASASKGESWLLCTRPAESLTQAMPQALSAALARTLGWRFYRPEPVVAACSTSLYGLLAAADAIAHGQSSAGLAGAVDASLQPFILAGFRNAGALAEGQPSAFDGTGTGFAAGEGAGFLALANRPGPWRLLGGVRLGDASHPTRCDDPTVLRACLQALWRCCPQPDLIVAHATGTTAGDAYELAALDDGPWAGVARMAAKPVIGHCLGASGSVELAAALSSPATRIWKLGLGFNGHVAAVALAREN